jgi:hypothetical protein
MSCAILVSRADGDKATSVATIPTVPTYSDELGDGEVSHNDEEECVDGASQPRNSDVVEQDVDESMGQTIEKSSAFRSNSGAMHAVDGLLGSADNTIGLLRMPVALSVGNGDGSATTTTTNPVTNTATTTTNNNPNSSNATSNTSNGGNVEGKIGDGAMTTASNVSKTATPIEILEVPNPLRTYINIDMS